MDRRIVSGMLLTLLLVGMLTLTFNTQPAGAEPGIITVPDDYPEIQEAIDHADEGDTIQVRAGRYSGRDGLEIKKNGLRLLGEDASTTIITSDMDPVVGVYAENVVITGFTISADACWDPPVIGVHVENGFNLSFYGNIFTWFIRSHDLYMFIEGGSNDCSILGNRDSELGKSEGIYIWGSSHMRIVDNNIMAAMGGSLSLWRSHNNVIFHNNLKRAYVENSLSNIWDNGYPSGGNYWSDYEGVDANGDGIGDTPYIIDDENQDNYPLMEPYSPLPRTIDELKTEIERLGSEDEIDNQGIVTSLLAKLDAAQKLIGDGKTDQALNLLNAFMNEAQAQSGKHITPEAAETLIESAEYVLSNL